jgi:hypothetical protein
MDGRLQKLIGELRVITRHQKNLDTQRLAEGLINKYLRDEVDALTLLLERVGEAIDVEADKAVSGEDWTLIQDYVRWFLEKLAIEGWPKG